MTPEREKEIRNFVAYRDLGQTGGPFEPVFYKELLEEIDSLRRDLASAQIRALTYLKSCEGAQKEIDTLRARVEKLREALTHYSDGYQYDKCSADETVAVNALAQDDEMERKNDS
jgi:predicted  nucleic acid-binding Zn-ribbon protein